MQGNAIKPLKGNGRPVIVTWLRTWTLKSLFFSGVGAWGPTLKQPSSKLTLDQ